jgi:hypothetical protein
MINTLLDEPIWLILPAAIRAKVDWRLGEGETILPPNMLGTILRRLKDDPARAAELRAMAAAIRVYLEEYETGWGTWPLEDTVACMFIGILLGEWYARDIDEQIADFPEADFEFLEAQCKEEGISTEQYLFDRLTEAREGDG